VSEHVSEQHAPGLWPVPGDGVLARHGDLVLLSSLDDSPFVDTLLDLLEHVAATDGDGRRFADAVADAVEIAAATGAPGSGEAAGPSVLAFGPTASGSAVSGLAVTVSGTAWADVILGSDSVRISAGHPAMLLRCVLRAPAAGVRGGLGDGDTGAASTDRFSRLDAGTVRASGLSYFAAEAGLAAGTAVPARASAGAAAGRGGVASPEAGAAAPDVPESAAPESSDAQAQDQQPLEQSEPSVPMMPVEAPAPILHEPTAAWIPPEPQASMMPPAPAEAAEPEVTIPPDQAAVQAGPYGLAGQAAPPAQSGSFEAVLLVDGAAAAGVEVPQREPLSLAKNIPPGVSSYVSAGPIIQGVYCKNGHFDDPEALFCAICGISMNQQTLVPRPGERPPLGVLLMDDGAVFQLDTDYVVGREPGLDSAVAGGRARPLRIADDSGIVSRVHASVRLDGWRVLVTDLGSANGTKVQLPGQPDGQILAPQVPVVLATGSQVDLGGRSFRYESHRGH
jgi:hypothetical protein